MVELSNRLPEELKLEATPQILVVDDDGDTRELFVESADLITPNCEVSVASTLDEAVKMAELSLQARKPFHLLLLDFLIPGSPDLINSAFTAELISRMHREAGLPRPLLIGFTALHKNHPDVVSSKGAFDGYLEKPFEFSRLNELAAQSLDHRLNQIRQKTVC